MRVERSGALEPVAVDLTGDQFAEALAPQDTCDSLSAPALA
jgi:hypothetical protein